MRKYNLARRFFAVFPLILLVAAFLVLPKIGLAVEFGDIPDDKIWEYVELPKRDVENILRTLIQKFSDEWQDLFVSDDYSPEKSAVPLILKAAVQGDILNYMLVDAPIEVSVKIIKTGIETTKLISTGEISKVIEKIEQETVKRAVDYGMSFFLEKEIKVTPGAIEFKYRTNKGQIKSAVFQYLIIYQSLNDKKGNVEIKFYSQESLKPPKNRGSYAMINGTYTDLEDNLPPFVVNISGVIEKDDWSNYKWVKDESPKIKIDFPEVVPDLGIKPSSFWERMVLRPLKNELKQVKFVVSRLTQKASEASKAAGNIFDEVSAFAVNAWDKIKSVFVKLNPFSPAALVQVPVTENEQLLDETASEGTSETFSEPIGSESETGQEIEPETAPENRLTLVQIQETLDDLAEEIDAIWPEIEELLGEQVLSEEEITGKKEIAETKELRREEAEEQIILAASELASAILTQSTPQKLCEKVSGTSPASNKVIINEVVWMGTENSAGDEWFELKNISGAEIDLSGWQISDKDGQIKIIFGQDGGDRVSAGGFYFLERTSDETVVGIAADKIYNGAINNSEEALYLFNQDCRLEDEVLANLDWPAGDNGAKKTMERRSDFGWQTSQNPGGTPKSENSAGYFSFSPLASPPPPPPETSQPQLCSLTGNESPLLSPVILNEVAWMGSQVSWANEWIELKNISATTVSLENWQLLDKDNQIKIIFGPGAAIPAQGFYLFERTDDDSAPGISADLIYTGGLEDSEETLWLFDQGCNLIDQAQAEPDWPAGSKEERRTMERTPVLGWQTYQGQGQNEILGTPKQENSQSAVIPEPVLPLAQGVVISEIQLVDKEFIEFYNPLSEPVSAAGWYLAYFSSGRDWQNSYRNWQFPEGAVIPAKGYYLVGIFGYPKTNGNPPVDWVVLTQNGDSYSSGQLGNSAGSIAVFSCDPENASSSEAAQGCKVDALAWQKSTSSDALKVKEGEPVQAPGDNQSLERKNDGQENYFDSDNNFQDFVIKEPVSPTNSLGRTIDIYPPEVITDLAISGENNNLILAWSSSNDRDTPKEKLFYQIFYSRNDEIAENNLSGEFVLTATTSKTSLVIPDLFYNSTYYFSIRAFDGWNWSPLSAPVSYSIPSAWENSLWPLWRQNPQHTGQSQLLGLETETSTIEKIIKGSIVGPNLIFYSDIALPGRAGLLAQDKNGEQKWFYQGGVGGFPALGPDGTIYIFGAGKIMAFLQNGSLKWEMSFPGNRTQQLDSGPLIDRQGRIYFSFNLLLSDNSYEPALILLDDSFDKGEVVWIYGLRKEKRYSSLDEILRESGGLVIPPSVSAPAIDNQGNIYIGYSNNLLVLGPEGDLSGKKNFPSTCSRRQCQPYIANISIDEVNNVFYVLVYLESDFMNLQDAGFQNCVHGLNLESREEFWKVCAPDFFGPISFSSDRNVYVERQGTTWLGGRAVALDSFNPKDNRGNWEKSLYQLSALDNMLIDRESNVYLLAQGIVKVFNPEGVQISP